MALFQSVLRMLCLLISNVSINAQSSKLEVNELAVFDQTCDHLRGSCCVIENSEFTKCDAKWEDDSRRTGHQRR